MSFNKKNGIQDLVKHSPTAIILPLQETTLNNKNRSVALEQVLTELGYPYIVSTETEYAN